MAVLDVLLQESLGVGDRLVVVSQSTAALDLVQVGAGWGVGGGGRGLLPRVSRQQLLCVMGCTLDVPPVLRPALPDPHSPPHTHPHTPLTNVRPQLLCERRALRTVRIDGGTDVAKRHDIVHAFNSHGVGQVRCSAGLCGAVRAAVGMEAAGGGERAALPAALPCAASRASSCGTRYHFH